MSNGCAPVLASYSAITLFTSSMSAVAGSYSRSVVSPCDENVRILAFMFGLLRDVHLRSSVEQLPAGFESLYMSYCTISGQCQDGVLAVQLGIARWSIRGPNGWRYREIRIGIFRLSRIGENKIYRPSVFA